MAYGADASTMTRDTEDALKRHEVGRVTLIVMVRTPMGVITEQVVCRPAERAAILAKHGVSVSNPLRSPRYAYAWRDNNGQLHVGGTSEKGKDRLRKEYNAQVIAGEDLVSF